MHEINPYAPTVSEAGVPLGLQRVEAGVTSLSVFLHTLTGITASGVAFGGCVFVFAFIASGGRMGGSELVFFPVSLIVGAVLAGVFGTLTIVGMMLLSVFRGFLVPVEVPLNELGQWTPTQINRFASSAGAISGFVAMVVPTQFDLSAMVFALIPAAFGLAGALFSTRRCIRRAKVAIAEAEANAESAETPLSFDTPST